jgi:hypothetical protein
MDLTKNDDVSNVKTLNSKNLFKKLHKVNKENEN